MAEKINNLSSNIVNIMFELAKNDGLARLLVNENLPFDKSKPNIINPSTFGTNKDDRMKLINPSNPDSKISPYPFDPEATIKDSAFIRVYYNQGEFNENETIQEMQLNIDIVVAKSLWLINGGSKTSQHPNGDGKSLIRPYEIMDRVVDIVGKRSFSNLIRVKFDGWQHLAVNTKFDAIRLYSDYFSVEAENHYGN